MNIFETHSVHFEQLDVSYMFYIIFKLLTSKSDEPLVLTECSDDNKL
jgi:hypothetical protein